MGQVSPTSWGDWPLMPSSQGLSFTKSKVKPGKERMTLFRLHSSLVAIEYWCVKSLLMMPRQILYKWTWTPKMVLMLCQTHQLPTPLLSTSFNPHMHLSLCNSEYLSQIQSNVSTADPQNTYYQSRCHSRCKVSCLSCFVFLYNVIGAHTLTHPRTHTGKRLLFLCGQGVGGCKWRLPS